MSGLASDMPKAPTRKKSINIADKLALRQIKEQNKRSTYYDELPPRLTFKLRNLVDDVTLKSGHVFLGFTKDGQFVLSYTMKLACTAFNFSYNYKLHWWLFIPYKPLKKVSEIHLFGGHDIFSELFLSVCQWPTDEHQILIHGSSRGKSDDGQQCFLTVTAIPPAGYCKDCHSLREQTISKNKNSSYCLKHIFAVHASYCVTPPFPWFKPKISLKIDGLVVINTGDSLFAFEVYLSNTSQQRALMKSGAEKEQAELSRSCSLTGMGQDCSANVDKTHDASNGAAVFSDSKGSVVDQGSALFPPSVCSHCKQSHHVAINSSNSPSLDSNCALEDSSLRNGAVNASAKDLKTDSQEVHAHLNPATVRAVQSESANQRTDVAQPSSPLSLLTASPGAETVPSSSERFEKYDDNHLKVDSMTERNFGADHSERAVSKSFDKTVHLSSVLEFLKREQDETFQQVGVNIIERIFVDSDNLEDVSDEDNSAPNINSVFHDYVSSEVRGSNQRKMRSVTCDSMSNLEKECLVIKQQMIDVEQFIHEVAQQCCTHAGETFLAIDDYDVHVLEVFPETHDILIVVLIFFISVAQGTQQNEIWSKNSDKKVHELRIAFMWNVLAGTYSIVQPPVEHEISPQANSKCRPNVEGQRERRVSDSYASCINVLTNKAVLKGSSLKYLVGPYVALCL